MTQFKLLIDELLYQKGLLIIRFAGHFTPPSKEKEFFQQKKETID